MSHSETDICEQYYPKCIYR